MTKITRLCGDCTLCCKLMPVKELEKPASTRCIHQRFRNGCHQEHEPVNIPAIQIWIDPNYPQAHRNTALRRYLLRQGELGAVGLVRFNSNDSVTLMPPNMMKDKQWHEIKGQQEDEHTPKELLAMFGLAGLIG